MPLALAFPPKLVMCRSDRQHFALTYLGRGHRINFLFFPPALMRGTAVAKIFFREYQSACTSSPGTWKRLSSQRLGRVSSPSSLIEKYTLLSNIWKITVAEGLLLTASSKLVMVVLMLSTFNFQKGLARQFTDSPRLLKAAASLKTWLLPTMMTLSQGVSRTESSESRATSLLVVKLWSRFTSNLRFSSEIS